MAVWNITHTLLHNPRQFSTTRTAVIGRRRSRNPVRPFRSIRFKLTLFIVILIAATAVSVSMMVMQIMDRVLLTSLVQRGSAITQALATPAGYSLLINDQLALDNLAAQIKQAQEDLAYVAILNLQQEILAHNQIDQIGLPFSTFSGKPLPHPPGLSIVRGQCNGMECLEFRRPILFADQHVGDVVIGISTASLLASKAAAHRNILLIAAMVTALALLGVSLMTSFLTRPIARLAQGVARLQKGNHVEPIRIQSRDELGALTRNFNLMAQKIQNQNKCLQESAADLESSYNDMVRILAAALDARDNYTYGHSARVARLSLGLAEKINLDRESKRELELACLLHDIGKIHVPDAILNKRGSLDRTEHQQIIKHPVLGSQILELAPSLHRYIPTVKHHHERFDGTGYPDQLRDDAIPLLAQIVSLADTYDAITSSRPYRQGRSREEAVSEIRRCSGHQFNPQLVEPFIEVVYSLPEEMPETFHNPEILCAS